MLPVVLTPPVSTRLVVGVAPNSNVPLVVAPDVGAASGPLRSSLPPGDVVPTPTFPLLVLLILFPLVVHWADAAPAVANIVNATDKIVKVLVLHFIIFLPFSGAAHSGAMTVTFHFTRSRRSVT